jgi:transcription initiation factor TFIIB
MNSQPCQQCGNEHLITDYQEGTLVCTECGLVQVSSLIDEGAEWGYFDADEGGVDPRRVGGTNNTLLTGQGLSTVISGQFNKLSEWNNRITMNNTDRTLIKAYAEIGEVCHALSLGEQTKEQACLIFKLAEESGKLRRKPRAALIAAIVYLSCRKTDQKCSIVDIFTVKQCKKQDVVKCYRLIRETLPQCTTAKSPQHYVRRLSTRLSLPPNPLPVLIAEKIQELDYLPGESARLIAAVSALYAARLQDLTITDLTVAAEAGVGETAFRAAYAKLVDKQSDLLTAVQSSLT